MLRTLLGSFMVMKEGKEDDLYLHKETVITDLSPSRLFP